MWRMVVRGLPLGMMEVHTNYMHTIPELGRTYGGDGELGARIHSLLATIRLYLRSDSPAAIQ